MTIEQKAKAFDEALGMARKELQACGSIDCDAARQIFRFFPELKESEDEKIRKALIDYFDDANKADENPLQSYGIHTDKAIAWLEKHGERQTPQNNERAWLYLVADVLTWREGIGQYLDNPKVQELAKKLQKEYGQKLYIEEQGNPTGINPSEFDLRLNKLLKQFETLPKEELASSLSFYLNVVQNDGTYKADEKQDKQNPCETCEEPRLNCQNFPCDRKRNFDSANKVEPKFRIGDVLCDKSCTTLNKDAQSNFEITDIRNGLYICDKCSFPISQQDEYELVAKKIEQKSAEWSEEDEKNLIEVISIVQNISSYDKPYDRYISWLKSLRPQKQWKPSKEQMKALHDLNLTGNISYAGQGQTLIELYEQLKKL